MEVRIQVAPANAAAEPSIAAELRHEAGVIAGAAERAAPLKLGIDDTSEEARAITREGRGEPS
jgi:hypothetical protein